MSRAIALLVSLGLAGCGSPSTPLSPSSLSPSVVPAAPSSSSIVGFVLDSGFRSVAGAKVEVLDGPEAGSSTTTDTAGQFSLTGTFDPTTRFRATGQGYVTATQTWNCSVGSCPGPTGARPWLGFYLAPLTTPVNIAGDYTLTFIADSACADLPSAAHARTYAATIALDSRPNTPVNTSFTVTVSGAPFLPRFNSFGIGVAGDYLGFNLHGGHDPPLVEQLAPNAYLAFSGNAAATVGASGAATISTTFRGWIEYCELKSPMGSTYNCGTSPFTGEPIPGLAVAYSHCQSENHQLIFWRR